MSSDKYPRERHEELHIAALLEQQLQTLDAWLSLMRDNDQVYAETTYSRLRNFLVADLALYNPLQQQLLEAIMAQCLIARDVPDSRQRAIREAKHLIRHRVWPRLGGASKKPHPWAEAYCSPGMRLALQAAALAQTSATE